MLQYTQSPSLHLRDLQPAPCLQLLIPLLLTPALQRPEGPTAPAHRAASEKMLFELLQKERHSKLISFQQILVMKRKKSLEIQESSTPVPTHPSSLRAVGAHTTFTPI